MKLNANQRRTLEALFETPTRANIRWDRIATLHRPHPRPTAGKATVEDIRRFFENAGIKP